MITPLFPESENARLETLRALKILDTAPEERFDRITRMAKRMFGVPISLVSLVDSERQWFKSAQGLDASETPRNVSFCGHAILGDDLFYIPNALDDKRFYDNPLVVNAPEIRFYAGSPLKAANGHKVGTLCLIDSKPHELDEEDKLLLKDLGAMVEQEIAAMQLATMDELTHISNRRGFNTLATHALSMCRRNDISATALLFDLNKFKPINDTFGHAEGDRALKTFADLLKQVFRDSDVFARIGGDEFAALLTGTSESEAHVVIERFRNAVSTYNKKAKRGYDIEFSVGTAEYIPDDTVETLLDRADSAMYSNKRKER
ncbi:sensor domain-containing diguanylate cyclase [Alteromonas sp. ASW11-19]|uniref:Sensor domain-containing diguanylate cyclase n=1 Tax=Alteromonas salexigens TaxID=2982530 RepID=A0ABT2VNZ2_9ALTE|nr:sensor domain-containing diguanylate cyclase [Alteromonas salexigens]MCU7554597.1 sensor domain-containing diguanylate cyclase [Alteromonas salexigens]